MPDGTASSPGRTPSTPASPAVDSSDPASAAEEQGKAPVASDELTVEQLEDRWRRAVADLDNVRKRSARELGAARANERAAVAAQFLPVLDNLELALAHADADPATILEGLRAVRDQAIAVLDRLGYGRREQAGVPFNPAAHEVVTVVDDPDAAPGTVVRVLRPGYGDTDNQLRPAAVAVARRE
ncbi:MAG: putative GrpE heat shock protein [Frankiales bacterium]|nr:putative GrpE heat shock protein [Frankiales bacterium]